MPLLGFGVYLIPAGEETERAVGAALATGYRHVDTAQAYGNEADVGRALRASGLARRTRTRVRRSSSSGRPGSRLVPPASRISAIASEPG